jgi:isopenicillin N synthase-like dioxygenase
MHKNKETFSFRKVWCIEQAPDLSWKLRQMALTPKQERFAHEVASGKSQAEAYRTAFNVKPTTKPETSQANACRLMADSNVSTRVAELRAAVAERVTWTMADSLDVLSTIAKGLDADAKPSDKVNAVKAINTMIGLDAPSKLDVTGNMVTRIERVMTDDNSKD